MKTKGEKSAKEDISEGILQTVGKIIPGFHGFFKKVEGSKTFGPKVTEIRKEIERRFGQAKK